jgi:hypothetical protein
MLFLLLACDFCISAAVRVFKVCVFSHRLLCIDVKAKANVKCYYCLTFKARGTPPDHHTSLHMFTCALHVHIFMCAFVCAFVCVCAHTQVSVCNPSKVDTHLSYLYSALLYSVYICIAIVHCAHTLYVLLYVPSYVCMCAQVSVCNRSPSKVDTTVARAKEEGDLPLQGHKDPEDFIKVR